MKYLKSKKVILIVVLAVLLIVGIAFGYSFAYFTASVVNDSTINNTVVTTASLEIEFSDGPKVSLENATPGQEKEKTFKVKNNSSLDTTYDIYMSEVINTFVDKSDLVYTLESSDGGANITTETEAPATSSKIVDSHILRGDEEQNYKLKIKFKETNDNQDDNKEKQFDVTIRINEVHDAPENAIDKIKNLVKDEPSSTTYVINKGSKDNCTYTLAYDGTADNNLRYVGKNPCNYVSYNDESWRIVGVMNNIETSSGSSESLLKIRRSDSLGSYSYDSSASGVNSGYGINQWGESTYNDGTPYEGADLMRELNNDYLGNVIVGTDGRWYNGGNESKLYYNTMPTSVLNAQAQGMIENVVWHLGSPNNDNGTFVSIFTNDLFYASYTYEHERTNTNGDTRTSSYGGSSDTVVRTSTWTGKVGLIYPSDFLYATMGGSSSSRDTCLSVSMYNGWNRSSNPDCKTTDWLYNSSYDQWTMSPFAYPTDTNEVFSIGSYSGAIGYTRAMTAIEVRPVVFLKSSVKITGGSGTQVDPYTLG